MAWIVYAAPKYTGNDSFADRRKCVAVGFAEFCSTELDRNEALLRAAVENVSACMVCLDDPRELATLLHNGLLHMQLRNKSDPKPLPDRPRRVRRDVLNVQSRNSEVKRERKQNVD